MPYQASNPFDSITHGLLAGSSLALQYRQVQNQEEQNKIANEDKELATAIAAMQNSKDPVFKKLISEKMLTPALQKRGYLPEGHVYSYDSSPAAKNYFQIVADANKMIEKQIWTKDEAQSNVLEAVTKLKDTGASGVPADIEGGIRKDVGPPVAEGLLAQARYSPATSAAQATTPESIAGPATLMDPAYQPYKGDIEKYAGSLVSPQTVESNKTSLLSRASVLDPGAAEKYRTEIDREKPKPTNETVPGEYHAYAQADYGKNWSELAPPEKKAVIAKVKADKVEERKATLAAGMEGVDIPDLASSVQNGEAPLSSIKNTRGVAITNKVMSEVKKTYPHFNFLYADANAKYITSTANQRIIGAVDASLPRVNMLAEQAEKLKNTPIPKWNSVLKTLSVETGDPTYTNFMSNRNAIVQEVNTALSGSSQSSDMRVQIELENLREARSPAQLAGAITNLREALIARKDASTQYIYPLEVVRGEKSKKQWDEEQKAKYRGKFQGNTPSTTTGGTKVGRFTVEVE